VSQRIPADAGFSRRDGVSAHGWSMRAALQREPDAVLRIVPAEMQRQGNFAALWKTSAVRRSAMNATYKNAAKEAEQGIAAAADQLTDTVRDGGKSAMKVADDVAAAAKQTLADATDTARDVAGSVKDAAEDAMEEGRSRLGGTLRKAQDTALDAKDALVSGAASTLASVKEAAVEKADEARESLSDVGDRLAATLQRASTETDSDALKSRVLSSVAKGVTSASDALRERSVADLTSDLKALARRHPGAFMAAAAVAGFAAARFVRSSSQRRLAERDQAQGPRV
jgi:hypothetical protein